MILFLLTYVRNKIEKPRKIGYVHENADAANFEGEYVPAHDVNISISLG